MNLFSQKENDDDIQRLVHGHPTWVSRAEDGAGAPGACREAGPGEGCGQNRVASQGRGGKRDLQVAPVVFLGHISGNL